MQTSLCTDSKWHDPKYEEGNAYQRCEALLEDLKITAFSDFKLRKEIRCDYYGFNHEQSIIIKRKQSLCGAEQAVFQLLRCYESFIKTKWYLERYPDMRLIIFYDSLVDVDKFLKIHNIYRDYIKNFRCPPMMWCYRDENSMPVVLLI